MFLEEIYIQGKFNRLIKRYKLQCDFCKKEFISKSTKTLSCSKDCLKQLKPILLQEKYGEGIINISLIESVKNKRINTIKQRKSEGKEYTPHNKVAEQNLILKICKQCKCEFKVLPCRKEKQQFCSKKCRVLARTSTPNFKNRGKISSLRSGGGISGIFKEKYKFRSTYELSFLKYLIDNNIQFRYEDVILKENDQSYIPDFICDDEKIIYEIKNSYSIKSYSTQEKIKLGEQYANSIGYTFIILTEETFPMLSYEEIVKLVINNEVVLAKHKNMGFRYKQLFSQIERFTNTNTSTKPSAIK